MKTKTENLATVRTRASAVGQFLGLTGARVRQLAGEGRIPGPDAAGRFPLMASVKAYSDFLRSRADVATVIAAKRRKLQAQAEITELKLGRERGELVEAKAVELVWAARKAAVREIVSRSALPNSTRDEILRELEAARAEDYLEKTGGMK